MTLIPRPNVHLFAEMFNHLLDSVVMVASTVPRHATTIAARPTALLRRGRVRTIPAQALNEAGIVKSVLVVGMSVHTRRVLVHRVGGLVPEYRTTIPVRQQRRQFVLLIRPRVRKILVVRFVLVNVVQVMRKEFIRRRDIPVVQRTPPYLQAFQGIISVSKSMVIVYRIPLRPYMDVRRSIHAIVRPPTSTLRHATIEHLVGVGHRNCLW